jgi:hypothetical protein
VPLERALHPRDLADVHAEPKDLHEHRVVHTVPGPAGAPCSGGISRANPVAGLVPRQETFASLHLPRTRCSGDASLGFEVARVVGHCSGGARRADRRVGRARTELFCTTWQWQGNSGPSNDTGTVRWLSEVLGCAIVVEVIPVGAGVGFVSRTAQVRRHRVSRRAPAPVIVKMPADGAAREIGVAQRMDERAVLLDRQRARFPGANRQVGT